jgi:hypothetical protein
MEKNCVCLICHKPNKIYLDFLNTITEYNVVVIIDDENEQYYKNNKEYYDINYPRIMIAQFHFINCIEFGFQLSNLALNKIVSGWDKAMYFYFLLYNDKIEIKKKYNHVWFIEDDVFFYDENVLKNIDKRYSNSDLLSNTFETKKNDENWLWTAVKVDVNEPYYKTMVCACRMSNTLLSHIFDYATKYKELFFLEVMFPTLAMKHNLICDFPEELKTIEYRKNWIYNEVNKTNMFHPIKNVELHKLLREAL